MAYPSPPPSTHPKPATRWVPPVSKPKYSAAAAATTRSVFAATPTPPAETLPAMPEPFSHSIRDSIGARTLASLEKLVSAVNEGVIPLEFGYYMVEMLVDTNSPFCTSDIATVIGSVEKGWRGLLAQKKATNAQNMSIVNNKSYGIEEAAF